MTRRRTVFDLWLRHHGLAIAYRLTAAAALADGDPPHAVALLQWEAQRHQDLANRRRRQTQSLAASSTP